MYRLGIGIGNQYLMVNLEALCGIDVLIREIKMSYFEELARVRRRRSSISSFQNFDDS